MRYHNSTQLEGKDLDDAIRKSKNQSEAIYLLMRRFKEKKLTPRRITWLYRKYLGNIQLTSARRSISDMVKEGILEYGETERLMCPIDGFMTREKIVKITTV